MITANFPRPRGRTRAKVMHSGNINILIACEESQAETIAFLRRGFNVYSCDIQPCRKGGLPSRHICEDVTPFLNGKNAFHTMDGTYHFVERWHMIIAHPPCTYLCNVSAVQLVKHGIVDTHRLQLMQQARHFFFKCLNAKADYIAVENPVPMRRALLPRPSCYIQPSWFGAAYTKKTLYWLKGLPPIMAEIVHPSPKCYVMCHTGKYRSRTLPQVAEALARQWGDFIIQQLGGA